MLPDLLDYNLKLIICGSAVGSQSAQAGYYYAGRGNKLWKTLYEIGLTDKLFRPDQYPELLNFGIGLTDLVKSKSGSDNILNQDDFGIDVFIEKIVKYKPGYICFNGKRSAKEFLGRDVKYGLQLELVETTKIFVAPSTSGAANASWDIELWKELAELV